MDNTPDLDDIIEVKIEFFEVGPERQPVVEPVPEHYIVKDYSENYLEKQNPPVSDIMFPPRIP